MESLSLSPSCCLSDEGWAQQGEGEGGVCSCRHTEWGRQPFSFFARLSQSRSPLSSFKERSRRAQHALLIRPPLPPLLLLSLPAVDAPRRFV